MNFSKQLANLQKSVSLSRQQGEEEQSQSHSSDGAGRLEDGIHYERGQEQRNQRRVTTSNGRSRNNNHHHRHDDDHDDDHGDEDGNRSRARFASNSSRSRDVTGYHPYPSHSRQSFDRHRHRPHQASKKRRHHHYLTPSEQDFYLSKLVNAIPKYHPLFLQTDHNQKNHHQNNNNNNNNNKNQRRHVCLLFLTIDDLPLEDLWRAFLDSQSNNSDMIVSVICHAKFPERVQSPWLKKRLMALKPSVWELEQYRQRHGRDSYDSSSCLPPIRYFSRRPEWGSIEITRAMIDLLEEGLRIGTSRDNTDGVSRTIKDPRQASEYRERYSSRRYVVVSKSSSSSSCSFLPTSDQEVLPTVDRFVFVSETCLPVVTMSEFETSLFGNVGKEEECVVIGGHNGGNAVDDVTGSTSCGTLCASSSKYNGQDSHKSWINARNTPNNGYARQLQWDAMDPAIPPMHIWKADQWILLTRHHAWPMISLVEEAVQSVQVGSNANVTTGSDDRDGKYKRDTLHLGLWQCFRNVKASDEMYFPTLMSLLGILVGEGDCEVITNDNDHDHHKEDSVEKDSRLASCKKEVCLKRVTYCDWSESAKNPATFFISRQNNLKEFKKVIKLARDEGCLFARKITMKKDELDPKDQSENIHISTGKEWLEFITTCT